MQPTLPVLFQEAEDLKKQSKDIQGAITYSLVHNQRYALLLEDLRTIKADMKMIKAQNDEEFAKEIEQLSAIKQEIADKNQMMADLALSKLAKGETIDIEGYDPQFSVKFKKK